MLDLRLKAGVPLLLFSVACANADFRSSSDKTVIPKSVSSACSATDKTVGIVDVPVEGDKAQRLELTGEFCPTVPSSLQILFVVDFSKSMFDEAEGSGNDPLRNGSCGRLEGVKALVNQHLAAIDKQSSKVSVAAITFASTIINTIPFTSTEGFASQATPDNFCHGATRTNYKIAFEAAQALLQNQDGTKVIYFITDGLPTEGGGGAPMNAPRHRDAATAALSALRTSVPGVVFNTAFIANTLGFQEEGFDPVPFLEQLTGDPARIKLVDKAENLARDVVTLELPAVDVDVESANAQLVLDLESRSGSNVDFQYFRRRSPDLPIWDFRTVPFQPFPDDASLTHLIISASKTDEGSFETVYNLAHDGAKP